VIKRLLFLASTLCTLIVVASFALFAVEEANASSTSQQNKIEALDSANPTPQQENARAHKHTKVREWIDDANDALTRPFDGVANSNNIWVQRGVPALLAFLLYFVVLRVLAGYAVKLRV
jgi:hypothetical protein